MLKTEDAPKHIPEDVIFDFDIYGDDRLTEELHESYETLHSDAPDVFWTPRNGGHWMITRYDDIMDVVRDPEHFSAALYSAEPRSAGQYSLPAGFNAFLCAEDSARDGAKNPPICDRNDRGGGRER